MRGSLRRGCQNSDAPDAAQARRLLTHLRDLFRTLGRQLSRQRCCSSRLLHCSVRLLFVLLFLPRFSSPRFFLLGTSPFSFLGRASSLTACVHATVPTVHLSPGDNAGVDEDRTPFCTFLKPKPLFRDFGPVIHGLLQVHFVFCLPLLVFLLLHPLQPSSSHLSHRQFACVRRRVSATSHQG